MKKNNRPVDWGDINQFQNEIDIQAEWSILRKKLQRKKKNRGMFLLFLSVASCFLLLIFLNGQLDKTANNKMINTMIVHQPNAAVFQKENCFEYHPATESGSEIFLVNENNSSDLHTYSQKQMNHSERKQNHSKLWHQSKPFSIYPANHLITQHVYNSKIKSSKDLISANEYSDPANITNPIEVSPFQNQNSSPSSFISQEPNSRAISPISPKIYLVHDLNLQTFLVPEIANQKKVVLQKPNRIFAIHFMTDFGNAYSHISSDVKELNTYIAKRNSIEKPQYATGIAANLEFKLNSKLSLLGELNYRMMCTHFNNSETVSYQEEQDNVVIEINKRPDGTEEFIRGKALVSITKTIHADYYNLYHTLSIPILLKYNFFENPKTSMSVSSGISSASYSWANGLILDPDKNANYLALNQTIKHLQILNSWMIRAEFGYKFSGRFEVSLFGQYVHDLTGIMKDNRIQQFNSSVSGGIGLIRFL